MWLCDHVEENVRPPPPQKKTMYIHTHVHAAGNVLCLKSRTFSRGSASTCMHLGQSASYFTNCSHDTITLDNQRRERYQAPYSSSSTNASEAKTTKKVAHSKHQQCCHKSCFRICFRSKQSPISLLRFPCAGRTDQPGAADILTYAAKYYPARKEAQPSRPRHKLYRNAHIINPAT